MKIAYFITAHGYGHGVRSCAIINNFSSSVELVLRTALPRSFFEEELNRRFELFSAQFDCGCVQLDSVTVAIDKTLALYKQIADNNRMNLEKETRWCKDNKIELIVSDCTPFAFDIAENAGIHSVAVTNFSWYDIYQEYADDNNGFRPYLNEIKAQYSRADLLLALQPSLPMKYFKNSIAIPFVGRIGEYRKDLILSKYGLSENKKIGLVYIGDFGMQTASWKLLESYKDWEFLGLHPIPGNPANYHLVNKLTMRYQDLIASADAVISKIGYGVVAECVLNGTPLVYLPRFNFAEYSVLEQSVRSWGGGYCIDSQKFYRLEWNEALEKIATGKRLNRVHSTGARQCADIIEKLVSA